MPLLRKYLLLGIVPALVAVGLTMLLNYMMTRSLVLEEIQQVQQTELQLQIARMEGFFQNYVARLEAIAAAKEIQGGNRQEILPYLIEQRKSLGDQIEGMYYDELNGDVYGVDGAQFNVSDREYFERVLSGETVISRLLQSRGSGENIVLVLVPTFDFAGKQIGAVGLTILERHLVQYIENANVSHQAKLLLIDSDANVIAGNLKSPSSQLEDRSSITDANGNSNTVVIGEATISGWSLALIYPDDTTFLPIFRRLRWAQLGGAGIGLAVAIALGLLFTNRALSPLKKITAAHARFAQGDKSVRLPEADLNEFAPLAQSFNFLASRLADAELDRAKHLTDVEAREARFRALFDAAADALFLVDANAQIINVNDEACRSLGYTREELLQLHSDDVEVKWKRDQIVDLHTTIVDNTSTAPLQGRHRRKDGTEFPVEVRIGRFVENGQPLFIAIVRNVEQRLLHEEMLRREKAMLERIMQASVAAITIVDAHDATRYANRRAIELLALTSEANVFQEPTWLRFDLSGKPLDKDDTAYAIVKRTNAPVSGVRYILERAPGDRRVLHINGAPLQDEHGEFDGAVLVIDDVTDDYEAERALKASEDRFQLAISGAQQGIWEWEILENRFFWSDRMFELFGLPPGSEAPSRASMRERLHPEDLTRVEAMFGKFLARAGKFDAECRFRVESGEYRWFRMSGDGVWNEEGEAVRLAGAMADITARKETERIVRENEERYRAIFEAAVNGFFIYALDGTLVDVNPTACRLHGYTRDEMMEMKPLDFIHPDSHPVFQDFLETIGQGNRFESGAIGVRKGGGVFYAHVIGVPYYVGGRTLALSTVVDVTESRLAIKERETLITTLEAKNTELERFTYTVSHDLKSPLITIKGFLGALAQDIDRSDMPAVEEDMQIISDAAEKMKDLLDDLLELSRIGRVCNPSGFVDGRQMIDAVLTFLAGTIAEKQVNISVSCDDSQFFGDRVRLQEVLQNLVENAIKYAEVGDPRVTIQLSSDKDNTTCWVRDNGPGIPAHFRDKIFGLFEKLDPHSDGTGIGLAIAKRIIEFHQGEIWVEANPVKGSCFCFRIPRDPSSSLISTARLG
ncbi:PAS domain S-box protein [Blastopirellula marina]|uniref:histidine kinase n=1 Tax=Blastopirellula marina DSM 3645 TaxID=314230 RepID=A3ZMC9_9BACT|nr:PAS domain S-box protein [Blastopirellula marina]EAQ82098.1 PAS sensor signal transduction histidine kinase [Blastopirellula marina DSM 3645]